MLIDKIEELCRERNMKFSELIQTVKLSQNSYTWKTRKKEPSFEAINKICDGLKITLSDFFRGHNNYELTEKQENFLKQWRGLNDCEQEILSKIIATFSSSKECFK